MFRANRYPKDWPAIRAEIRARAGERCECTGQCGDAHVDPAVVCEEVGHG